METNKTLLEKLRAPLPAEAISQHPTKPYLSTINAIYVVDRLNDVLGLGNWRVKNTIIEADQHNKMVLVKAEFTAKIVADGTESEIYIESFGGNDNQDRGDAYKGACTDALTKIASYLGVGSHVWKDKDKGAKKAAATVTTPTPAAKPAAHSQKLQEAADFVTKTMALTFVTPNTPAWKAHVADVAYEHKQTGTDIASIVRKFRDDNAVAIKAADFPELEAEVKMLLKKEGGNKA